MPANTVPALLTGSLVLGLAVALAARPETPPAGHTQRPQARAVRVAAVDGGDAERMVQLPGRTRARRRAALAFAVPARLVERPVDVGDRVHAGQLVARLEGSEHHLAERAAAASLAELAARLEQAQRESERVERLAAARAATAEELERAQSAVAALTAAQQAGEARWGETRRRLDETALRAPFSGTVTAVHLEPGEWAAPGAAVVEIAGDGLLEVQVEVPESVRARLAVGSEVGVELPLAGLVTTGTVTAVAAAADGGGLFPALVLLRPADGVVAGLAAEVTLPLGPEARLSVPLAAVLDSGSSRPTVFRITGGTAHRVEVEPGRVRGDRIEVRAPELAAGDQVAVAGHTALVDGDRVEVL